MNTVMLRYDDPHRRKQRRWIQGNFGDQSNVQWFATLQQREAAILVDGLMRTPNEYALHVKRVSSPKYGVTVLQLKIT